MVTVAYQPWQNFVSFNWYNSCSKEGFAQDRRLFTSEDMNCQMTGKLTT